jgi:hypothetical protein
MLCRQPAGALFARLQGQNTKLSAIRSYEKCYEYPSCNNRRRGKPLPLFTASRPFLVGLHCLADDV